MSTLPARRSDLVLDSGAAGMTVRDPATGAVHQLSPIAAAALIACDGTTGVAGVIERVKLAQPGVDDKLVWSALDELGSANLLAVRAAPPAGPVVDRRTLLRSVFVGGGAVAAGAAFGLVPGSESHSHALGIDRERKVKARERDEQQQKQLKAGNRSEEECKSNLSENRKVREAEMKAVDPAYKKTEQRRKQGVRQSEEHSKRVRSSVGLDSLDGDWRVPVTLDGPDGMTIEGRVDLYSFSLDGDANGACTGTMKVLVGGGSGKTQEAAAKSTELVRSGAAVLVSFNDEPAFEAKLSKADAGFTEFDAKGAPSGGGFTYMFWI